MSMVDVRASIRAYEKDGATIYENSYGREINGQVYEIVGHDSSNYIAVLNGQIQLLTAEEYNDGEYTD